MCITLSLLYDCPFGTGHGCVKGSIRDAVGPSDWPSGTNISPGVGTGLVVDGLELGTVRDSLQEEAVPDIGGEGECAGAARVDVNGGGLRHILRVEGQVAAGKSSGSHACSTGTQTQ